MRTRTWLCVCLFVCLFQRRQRRRDHIQAVTVRCSRDHRLSETHFADVGAEGIFRVPGRAQTRRRILASLKRGDRSGLRHQLEGAAIECAAALQMFLAHLRQPLIPERVQKLVLAENPGISECTVASDALGLLRQDLSGRHLELLMSLLDLLYVATHSHPTSELRGCSLPVALLPIFFDLKPADLVRWKQVAATFNELIITAPACLRQLQAADLLAADAGGVDANQSSDNQNLELLAGGGAEERTVLHLQEGADATAVTLLLRQRNRQFIGGEPMSEERVPTSVMTIPLMLQAQTRMHPLLRATS